MKSVPNLLRLFMLVPLLVSASAFAAPASGTLVELSVEASRAAANDLIRATAAAEATAATPGETARQVNSLIADSLKTAKAHAGVKVQNGGTHTYPVYSKAGKIEAWRMRSEIVVESGDAAAISELLGKLQTSLVVSNLSMQPAPETRKRAENEATVDALSAFKARAKVIADALGKSYRIKQLSVGSNNRFSAPVFRSAPKAAMMAEAAPMPVEAGESLVSVSVSGQIELE